MPTYVYRCPMCKTEREVQHRMSDTPIVSCGSCYVGMEKVIQPVGIAFHGSGFYVTDYGRDSARRKTDD